MTLGPEFHDHRLLLYYKGDISALTLFAQHPDGHVCLPKPLPLLSSVTHCKEQSSIKVSVHPNVLLNTLTSSLALDNTLLKIEPGFHETVDTPGGLITVYLARFMLLDPPHKLLHGLGYSLRTLPELRRCAPVELELLRRAYVKVMES